MIPLDSLLQKWTFIIVSSLCISFGTFLLIYYLVVISRRHKKE